MNNVFIDLDISSDEYIKMYEGVAKNVVAHARDGRRIKFPARILQSFLTHTGIHGTFVIYFDQNNKFSGIDRLR